jgi:hypothetical protein
LNLFLVFRVPNTLKQVESSAKTTTHVSKTSESWLPVPTPVPISSSRSFSELMKSEETLSAKVAQLHALLEQQQQALSSKDYELRALKMEVANGQEQLSKTQRTWEAKSEALMSQQVEKYQDLNDRYLVVLTRARSCEAKLEELFIDPLTLEPFETRVADKSEAEIALQQQRTILSLVEDHAKKDSNLIEQYQRETEQLLRRTLEEISVEQSNTQIDDIIAAVRIRVPTPSDQELKQVELSVPMLISESLVQDQADEEEESDLDWSIATTDELDQSRTTDQPIAIPNMLTYVPSTELDPMGEAWYPNSSEVTDGNESNVEDSFFNESVDESN